MAFNDKIEEAPDGDILISTLYAIHKYEPGITGDIIVECKNSNGDLITEKIMVKLIPKSFVKKQSQIIQASGTEYVTIDGLKIGEYSLSAISGELQFSTEIKLHADEWLMIPAVLKKVEKLSLQKVIEPLKKLGGLQ